MKKAQAKAKRHIYSSGLAGCGGKAEPTNAKNTGQPIFCPFCDRIFKQDGRFKEHLKAKHADQSEDVNANSNAIAGGPVQGPATGGEKQPQSEAAEARADGKAAYNVKTPKTLLSEWCQKNKRPMPRYKPVEVEGGFHCRLVLPDARDTERDTIFWYRETVCSSAQDAHNHVAVMGLHWVMGERRMDRVLEEQYQPQWRDLDKAMEERKERERRQQLPKRRSGPERQLQAVFMSEHSRRLVEGLIDNGSQNDRLAEQDLASRPAWDSEARGGKDEEDNVDDDFGEHDWDDDDIEITSDVRTRADSKTEELSEVSFSERDRDNYCSEDFIEGMDIANGLQHGEGSSRQETPHITTSSSSLNSSQGSSKQPNMYREAHAEKSEGFRSKLESFGFRNKDIDRVLAETDSLSNALDWLMLHVAESDLPAAFAPDASQASIKVVRRGAQLNGEGFTGDQNKQTTLRLCQSGYFASDVQTALFAENGDELAALCTLFKDLAMEQRDSGDDQVRDSFASSRTPKELAEMREEEWTAMTAIYEQDIVEMTENSLTLRLQWNGPEKLLLQFHIPSQSAYPLELPVLRYKGEGFTPSFFLSLTEKTASHAWQLVGQSMLYELACFAMETAPILWRETSRKQPFGGRTSSQNVKFPSKGERHRAGIQKLEDRSQSDIGLPSQPGKSFASVGRVKAVAETPKVDMSKLNATVTGETQPKKVHGEVSADFLRAESLRLLEDWKRWQKDVKYVHMRMGRSKLPAFAERLTLLETIKRSTVTIVSGQTGCGKSTQVPQYVLEEAVEHGLGASCNIICTQPRRISAIGVAERVAQERGEPVGQTVGYTIRLESRQSQRTRLLFCTTGVLLRRLQADPTLQNVTHVIVDEVHERSLDSDLLLLLLRNLLSSNNHTRSGSGGLRLILMSATADASLFSSYFSRAGISQPPVVNIPGFTHPVRELYLEDALELTAYRVGKSSKFALKKAKGPPINSSKTEPATYSHVPESWDSHGQRDGQGGAASDISYSESTLQSVAIVDEDILNYELMETVIYKILLDTKEPSAVYGHLTGQSGEGGLSVNGAILVFLPGMAEIRRLQSTLLASRRISGLSGKGGPWILPLHGSLTSDEQRRVFAKPPPGVQKVVLATNIAETSITIDDVVYVVDSGRLKEMQYEPSKAMACLVDAWVSQASANQRRGRAGRVRPGCCIRLFSRNKHAQLARQQVPEMSRVPLDNLCLQVKSILPGSLKATLSQALTPPSPEAVDFALKSLVDLQALTLTEEKLTPLGHHLSKMPVSPRVGKMLIYGCLLRCLDPILTVASSISNRPPFVSPMEHRNEANEAKRHFGLASKSDHLAVVNAYNGWREAQINGRDAARSFCDKMFLSQDSLTTMELSRVDYVSVLTDLGFVSEDYGRTMKGILRLEGVNANARNIRVVKAALCAGLSSHIVRVQHPGKTFVQQHSGSVASDPEAHEIKFYTKDDGRVFLHPSSVNFVAGKYESGWLVYGEKVKTSKVFIRECTMVPAYALLLFGGEIHVLHVQQILRVDGWMDFQAPARIAVLVRELRSKVDDALAMKISNASLDISVLPVVEALVHLLTTDGF